MNYQAPPEGGANAISTRTISKSKPHDPRNKMASPKKKATAKPNVRFKDLKSKKNPKGGAFDAYVKIEGMDSASPKLDKWDKIN